MPVTNFGLQVFDPDHHAKIRLRLSITVLEKKIKTDSRVRKNRPYVLNKGMIKVSLFGNMAILKIFIE